MDKIPNDVWDKMIKENDKELKKLKTTLIGTIIRIIIVSGITLFLCIKYSWWFLFGLLLLG
jgi:hypothetical protein